MEARAAIEVAARLEALGVHVRSVELVGEAKRIAEFRERGGNRAMRRATARAERRKGRR